MNVPLQDPALFTDSVDAQRYIRQDPYALRKITIGFAAADLQLNGYVRQAAASIERPALLMTVLLLTFGGAWALGIGPSWGRADRRSLGSRA